MFAMEQIELIEVNLKYADDIWNFRQEILECDAESSDDVGFDYI